VTLTGYSEAEHAELTERARAALEKERKVITGAAHREIDELVKLGVIAPARAERLKKWLTAEAVERHEQDGMSISDMVDMYRDLTDHP
jgi:uncharacterized protein YbjT (DUF2867 family)